MKLAYLANVRMPTEKAHGIQIMKMCEAFVRDGIELELIVPARRNKISMSPFEYYGIEENFKITFVPTIDFVGLIPRIGFVVQAATFLLATKVYLFRKKRLVYTRDTITNLLFKNTILELHTLPKNILRIHKNLYKRSKLIIVLTNIMKEVLQKNSVDKRIVTSPGAVDFKQFVLPMSKNDARERLSIKKNKKVILYSGHLYPWKGVDTLLSAAKMFTNEYQFILIGGTEKEITSLKKKTKGENNIIVKGMVQHKEVPMYLKAADIVVLPNSGKFEISKSFTSPMKLFEYMASGTPMIASDLSSIREIIDEHSATFFTPDDKDSLVESIQIVFESDQSSVKAMHARAVAAEYSWENRVKNILLEINA